MSTKYKPSSAIFKTIPFGTFVCLSEWASLHDLKLQYNALQTYRYSADRDCVTDNHHYSDGEGCFIYLLAHSPADLSDLNNVGITQDWELELFHKNGLSTTTPFLGLAVAVAFSQFFDHYNK